MFDRIAFKCNILAYLLKKEYARLDDSASKTKNVIANGIDATIKIVTDIHSFIENREIGLENFKNEAQRLSIQLNQICTELQQQADSQESSRKLKQLAQEYRELANIF